jgi:serine/threonine protein kinase
MGVVYRAHDVELQRDVAMKVLRAGADVPDLVRRLQREARVLAALEHPGIVPVHDVGIVDGDAFYVMKLVRGRRLDEWAAEAPPLAERLRALERICETVAFAHAHGVVHRDLKPGNVMLGAFGEVLVMDWGVAKVLSDAATGAAVGTDAADGETAAGSVLGTPGYMAPEQAAGNTRAVDARTDVYALGGLLHFLIAGGPPTAGPLPRGTPRPLAAIIRRCLAIAPVERYASPLDLAADVRAFQAQDPVSAYPEGPLQRAGRVASRYRVPLALVVTYMVMRLALIFWANP